MLPEPVRIKQLLDWWTRNQRSLWLPLDTREWENLWQKKYELDITLKHQNNLKSDWVRWRWNINCIWDWSVLEQFKGWERNYNVLLIWDCSGIRLERIDGNCVLVGFIPSHSVDEILQWDHSSESYWQYFPVVLFIMLYKLVLTFGSVDKILFCGAVYTFCCLLPRNTHTFAPKI